MKDAYMKGRVCLVTGATRGIGRATALALAQRGASVIVHGRDRGRVESVCREINAQTAREAASGRVADLASLAEVRRLAGETLAEHARLDVLINNAGVATRRRKTSADGYEWQFAVNHLAPFLLTNLLLPRIKTSTPARIVTVSSNAHRRGALDFEDLNWERRRYSGLGAYSATKLANILFTRELARRLENADVTATCLHPGVVATNIFGGMGVLGTIFGFLMKPFLLSPARGAETSIYLASSPDGADANGRFFVDCEPSAPAASARPDTAS